MKETGGETAGAFLDKPLSKRQNNKWYRIATVLHLMCVHQAGKLEMGKQRAGVLISFMDFLTMKDQTYHTLAQCQNKILTTVPPIAYTVEQFSI